MTVYLDWNATTPRHALVREAMDAAEQLGWANPSSVHHAGRQARKIQENARERLASLLSRSPRDVLFTGGGTEANHLALAGASILITSKIEHPSVALHAQLLSEQGTRVIYVDVDQHGRVVVESVEQALRETIGEPTSEQQDRSSGGFNNHNTPLVALMAANHETGVIQPLEQVHALTQRYGARLHVDAVQWVGRATLGQLLHADSVALSAHKFRGPKGLGALIFECGWSPIPMGRGGAQERGLRAGTVDAVALAGLETALLRLEESQLGYQRAAQLALALRQHITAHTHRAVAFHGADVPGLGHVLNLRFDGWKGDELVAALDLEGICVSSGSACSAGTAEPSAVITAMLGLEAAVGAVRISLGEETKGEDMVALVDALVRLGILNKVEDLASRFRA